MKLTAILVFITIMQVSATTYAQRVTLQERSVTLKQLFRAIRQQTGYDVLYQPDKVNDSNTIDANFKDMPLKDVLDKALSDQPLEFTIEDKTVVIKQKEASLLNKAEDKLKAFLAGPSKLSGTVTDTTGTPMVGATVTLDGTKFIATTDEEGTFTFNAIPEGKYTLRMSYIGFKTIRESIELTGNDVNIREILHSVSGQLSEVIVSNGYQKISQERATGSYDYIDNKTINREITPDIITRLDGIANSVFFDNRGYSATGVPSASNISIRGLSTIISSTTPLIVVDGVIYDGDINSINPNDVDNITVLKDAAASSIWGARAGNGVIVITTKQGKYNQPLTVNVSSNVTITGKPPIKSSQSYIDANDYINIEEMLFKQGFYNSELNDPSYPAVSPVVNLLNEASNGTISQSQANSQINALRNVDDRDQLLHYFYRNGINQQHNMDLTGGSNWVKYYFSAGYDNNELSQVGWGNSRLNINSSNTFKPLKNLEITSAIAYTESQSNSDLTLTEVPLNAAPYTQFATVNGSPLPIAKDYSAQFVQQAQQNGFENWQFNPLQELRDHDNTSTTNAYDTRINTDIRYHILSWLTASVAYSYERTNNVENIINTEQSYVIRNLYNSYANVSGNTFVSSNFPNGAKDGISNNTLNSQTARAQLNFDRSWGKSTLTGIIGSDIHSLKLNGSQNLLYGYNPAVGTSQPVDYLDYFALYPSNSYTTIPYENSISGTINHDVSTYTNWAYSYDNKYTVTASARRDASNVFGQSINDEWKPLWSTGASWKISNEKFYHLDFLSLLELKATYGYSGNPPGAVAVATISYNNGGAPLTNLPNAGIFSFPNDHLQWEQDGMINLAVNFSALKSRLSGSMEYFHKDMTNLLESVPLDPTVAGAGQFGSENIAKVTGNGFDLNLHSQNIKTRQFEWTTGLQASYYKDKVAKYIPSSSGVPIASSYVGGEPTFPVPIIGDPLEPLYAYKWAGLTHNTGDPQGYLNSEASTNYQAIMNGPLSGIKYIGSALPLYYGNLINTFTYKRVSLSFNIVYRFDYWVQKPTISYSGLFSDGIGNSDFYKRWQVPGDELKTTVPSLEYPADPNRDIFYANAEPNFIKGDNIRLQDIALSYDILSENKQRVFKTLRLQGYIYNIGILWRANKDHIDPDYLSLPPAKSYSIGLNAGF